MFNGVTVFNIREYLSGENDVKLGVDELRQLFSEFFCDKNPDVERSVNPKKFSNRMKNKIARVSEMDKETGTYTLSAYLIGQLGKNFRNEVNMKITGEELLQTAMNTIRELQYRVGGMVVFLEAEHKEKLLNFYEVQNGFKSFDTREVKHGTKDAYSLVQLLKVL